MSLLADATALIQQKIAVFPVRPDKRPAIKGWRKKATTDPKQIKEWFSDDRYGIGVPCGKEQDLVCFDVDIGHTDDPVRISKLQDFLVKWANVADDGYVLRKTRSGGYHLIFGWPENGKPPRRIMPKLDGIVDGFYFVWSMPDGSYTHVRGELADMAMAPDEMCKVLERDQFGDGGSLMSEDAAHEAMWSDGDAGIRHDALLRMTHDWSVNHPEDSVEKWCDEFSDWFTDIYGDRIDSDRLEALLEYDVPDERGELYRAFNGVSITPDRANAMLEAAGEKLRAAGKLNTPPMAQVAQVAKHQDVVKKMRGEFEDIDLNELLGIELADIDWIVDDLIPAGNLISITGPSGAGKTRFNAALMSALSTGETAKLGLPPADRPIRTLYIANEERTEDVKRRLKAAAKLNGFTGEMLITVRGKEQGRFSLVKNGELMQEKVDGLINIIKERDIELAMIDPVVTLGIEDENTAASVDVAMEALQAVAAATGACVMFVHHSPKDRTSPEDALRGDSGAWRGSGVFYSSLDLGLTLMPWLPEECHDRNRGKEMRRRWKNMVRNHQAPKYVVLDSAKERENEGLRSTMFEIVGQEVRSGGRKIGAMRYVSEAEAQSNASMLLASASEVDEAVSKEWARVMVDELGEGQHMTSLVKIAKMLDKKKPLGWSSGDSKDEKLRTDRGTGKAIMEHIGPPKNVSGWWVSLETRGKGIWCHVSKVS